jgi:hypothetical protein
VAAGTGAVESTRPNPIAVLGQMARRWDPFFPFRNVAAVGQQHEQIQNSGCARKNPYWVQIRRNGMSRDFVVELIAKNNGVFEVFRQAVWSAARLYQMCAYRRKLNRERWTTLGVPFDRNRGRSWRRKYVRTPVPGGGILCYPRSLKRVQHFRLRAEPDWPNSG